MPEHKANFFKGRREELGLTQRDIALRLEITDSAVSAWECAEAAPRLKLSAKLAEIYGVSESKIIREIVELSKAAEAQRAN